MWAIKPARIRSAEFSIFALFNAPLNVVQTEKVLNDMKISAPASMLNFQ
jgi:hypothetical protein